MKPLVVVATVLAIAMVGIIGFLTYRTGVTHARILGITTPGFP